MSEIRRLIELCERGDRDAAEALLRVAARQDNPLLALEAAWVLGDVERLVTLTLHILQTSDDDAACCEAFETLGFKIEGRAWLESAVDRRVLGVANKGARARKLTRVAVYETLVRAACDAHGMAWTHAGEGNSGKTSYVIAVRDVEKDGRLIAWGGRGTAKEPSLAKGFKWRGAHTFEACLRRARLSIKHLKPNNSMTITPTLDGKARLNEALKAQVSSLLQTARGMGAEATESGLEQLDERTASLLRAEPSRGAFEDLFKHLEWLGMRGEIEHLDAIRAWLDAHWSAESRRLTRSAIKRSLQHPGNPVWSLVRGLELPRSKNALSQEELEALGRLPVWRDQVEVLKVNSWPGEALRAFIEAEGAWRGVKHLQLHDCGGFGDFARSPVWRQITALEAPKAARAGFASALLEATALRSLSIDQFFVAEDLIAALASHPLHTLTLTRPGIANEMATRFFASEALRGRVHLTVDRIHPGKTWTAFPVHSSNAIAELASNPHAASLQTLSARDAPASMGGRVVSALVANEGGHLDALRALDVRGCKLDGEHLVGLAQLPGLARFESLRIVPQKGAEALREALSASPHLRVSVDSVLIDGVDDWRG